jgi:hypothetical protein
MKVATGTRVVSRAVVRNGTACHAFPPQVDLHNVRASWRPNPLKIAGAARRSSVLRRTFHGSLGRIGGLRRLIAEPGGLNASPDGTVGGPA